ncbi:MAG TPA: tetratricopeptide repeat protein [Pyrinomonadaceae bacterium]|nr:tetratricopeptide repeat protein [Pyrinomonadaceae bacterium]
MRFSQVTRLACASALVFSTLAPLHAAGFGDDTRPAALRAPLPHDPPERQVELTAEAAKADEPEGATAAGQQAATTTAAAKKRPNLFVRIISAPFRGLAKLFGGGDEKADETARAEAKENKKKKAQIAAAANQLPGGRTDAPRVEPTPAAVVVIGGGAGGAAASQPDALAEAAARSVRAGERVLSVPPTFAASTPVTTPSDIPAPPPPADAKAKESFDYEPRPFTPFIEGVAGDPLSQGRALLANGYTNEAVAELSVAAVTGPDLVEANNLLGLAYDRRGQHRQAREFYERALSVAPQNAQVLNNLGHSLYLDDRYADALARLKNAARLAPEDTRVAGNLALVYGRLRKYDEAFKQFKRAGGEFYAHTSTAALLATAGRDREAIKHYEAARKLNPAAPDVLRQLITLYVRTGQRDKAEAAERALDGVPVKAGASASS